MVFRYNHWKLINSYLTKRTQKVKINDQFSSWLDIIVYHMVYHSGLYFLNTFLCDIFLFCNNIDLASHSDDNTPSCIGKPPEEEISQWEKSSKSIFEWFENKGMKMNPNKCHLLLSKNDFFDQMSIKIRFLIQDLKNFSV